MRIIAVAFLALIGVFLAAGTATADSTTASGVQNSTTPASGSTTTSSAQNSTTPQMQFFPPVAYGSSCSKGAPVVAWNGAGSGKGTYCITLPICATGQFLTTVADTNGNPSFICVDPSTDSTAAAATTDGTGSASGSNSPLSTPSPSTSSGSSGLGYLESTVVGASLTSSNGCSATYLYTDPTTGLAVYDYDTSCNPNNASGGAVTLTPNNP
jgi:hypothetical protein